MKTTISDVALLRVLLPCLSCGDEGCLEMVLDDTGQLHCTNCDADIDADDIREHVEAWQALLAWSEALRRDSSRFRTGAQRN